MSAPEAITGTIEQVMFYGTETGYCVLKVAARGHVDLLTVVGEVFPSPMAGESLSAQGKWASHRKYGQQFQATDIEIRMPFTMTEPHERFDRFLGLLQEIQDEMKARDLARWSGEYEEILNHMLNKAFKLDEWDVAIELATEALAKIRGETPCGA